MAKAIQGDFPRRNWTGKGGQGFTHSSSAGEIKSNIGERDGPEHKAYTEIIKDHQTGEPTKQRKVKSPRSK